MLEMLYDQILLRFSATPAQNVIVNINDEDCQKYFNFSFPFKIHFFSLGS